MQAAIVIHEELLTYYPNDPGILNNLAWLYPGVDEQRALEFANRAHELAPESPHVLDTLGWTLTRRGEYTRGLKYLRQAFVRSPKDPQLRYHIAVALEGLGRGDEALRELSAALESGEAFRGREAAEALHRTLSAAHSEAG